jgi:Tfp pilus assembly protein PilV
MEAPMTLTRSLLILSLGALAALAYLLRSRRAAEAAGTDQARTIRDAGPAEMALPPRSWDIVDQQADESFPASDPPGNY